MKLNKNGNKNFYRTYLKIPQKIILTFGAMKSVN